MRRFIYFLAVLTLSAVLWENSPGKNLEMKNLRQVKVRAPELAGGKGWLNTDKPLSIAGLRGKIVLLDFWTYGCIN